MKRKSRRATPRSSPDAEAIDGGMHGRGRYIYPLLAILVVWLAYANSLANGFHFDDFSLVQNNVYLRNPSNIPKFFLDASLLTSTAANMNYRPVLCLSFTIDYWLGGGLNPRVFHGTQLALHLLIGAGLFFLFRRLLRQAGAAISVEGLALFGATLFCLHRGNTETVNYIAARSELLATAGVVAGMLLYFHRPHWRRTGVYLLPVIIGSLAKPTALIFPALLAGAVVLLPEDDAASHGSPPWRRAAAPGLAALAASGALFLLISHMGGPHENYSLVPRLVYLKSQIHSWLYYLELFVLPLRLSADHDLRPILLWSDPKLLIGAAGSAAYIAAAVIYQWRRPRFGRLFAYGTLWFYAALLPSSSIFPLTEMIREYRFYLPGIGLVICLLAVSADLWRGMRTAGPSRRVVLPLAGFLLLAAHADGTRSRNAVWRNELTLWESVTQASPENGRGWLSLGHAYLERRDYLRARECFNRAESLNFQSPVLEMNFAALEMAQGNMASAKQRFQRAIQLAPDEGDPHFSFAVWLMTNHQPEDAIREMRAGLALSPSNLMARRMLLDIYGRLGKSEEYCALIHETLSLAPDAALAEAASGRCVAPAPAVP